MSDRVIEKYIWETDGGCPACEALDGKEFKTIDEIPDKPHPYCDCTIREVDGELCDCVELLDDIEEMIGDAQSLKLEAEIEITEIRNIESEHSGIDNDDVQRVLRDINSLLHPLETLVGVLWDFYSNWSAMKEANTKGADKYYHAKANCEAAQRGIVGSAVAKGLSDLREYTDNYRNIKEKKMTLEASLKDIEEDQEANREGRDLGREYPTKDPKDILRHRRPKGLPEKYW